MGSITYDFLNESFLFDASLVEESYASVGEKELDKELKRYREYVISNLPALRGEINDPSQTMRIFGAKDYFSIEHLIQTAFYLDQVVLPDPLLPFSRTEPDVSKTMTKFLGMNKDYSINRVGLSEAVKRMKLLTPMVAGDYIKFFPISYYLEPGDQVPITFSPNAYSDILPTQVLNAYRERADVRSLEKAKNGWTVENDLKLGRGIAIHFKEDNDENWYIYNLFEQRMVKADDKTRIAHFEISLPSELPGKEYFLAWVNQSINQAAIAHYEQLLKSLFLSSWVGASFITSSPFTHSLLRADTSNKTIQSDTAEKVLNMDLPFIANASVNDIMSVRQTDGEAFELFRRDLESKFRELRSIEDPELVRVGIENAVHELSEVQVEKIQQKIKELRKGVFSNAVIAVGGLAGSVITSGASVAATAVAIANGYKSYSEYREKVRENPAYFLWKVKNA